MTDRGRVVVVSGPSGAGKSTLLKRLLAADPRLRFAVSWTTRPQRPGEVDGLDYHFVDQPRFLAERDAGGMIEWAEVHGNYYGTPRQQVTEATAAGLDLVLDIDVQGAAQIREQGLPAAFVFVNAPSEAILAERLRSRGTEDEASFQRRLANARIELLARSEFEFEVINDDVDAAVERLRCIIAAERCRIRP